MPLKRAATKAPSESRRITRTTTAGSDGDDTPFQTAGETPPPETLPANGGDHAGSLISTARGEKRMRPSGEYADSSDLHNPAKKQKGVQEAPAIPARRPSFNNVSPPRRMPRRKLVGAELYNFPGDDDQEPRPKAQRKPKSRSKSGTQAKAQVEPKSKKGRGRPPKNREAKLPALPAVETQEVIQLFPKPIPEDIAHNTNGRSVSEEELEELKTQHHEPEHEEGKSNSEPPQRRTRKNMRARNKVKVSKDERDMDSILAMATSTTPRPKNVFDARKSSINNPPMVEKKAKASAAKAPTQPERESEANQDIVNNDAMGKGGLESNEEEEEEEEEEGKQDQEEQEEDKERDEPRLPTGPPTLPNGDGEDTEYKGRSGGEDEDEGEDEGEDENGVSRVLEPPTPTPEPAQLPAASPKLARKVSTATGQGDEIADSGDEYVPPANNKRRSGRRAPSIAHSHESYAAAAQFHEELQEEGASDFGDDFVNLPQPLPFLYQKLLASTKGAQAYRKKVNDLSNFQSKLAKLQCCQDDEDENKGYFYILDDIANTFLEGGFDEDDEAILFPQLDKVLGQLRELQQSDAQIEADHRRLARRHAIRASNHRKCADAIRLAFKRVGYKGLNSWLTSKEGKERRRMEIAEKRNKMISDQLDRRIAVIEREEQQREKKYRSASSSARNTMSTGKTSTSSRHRRASSNDYDDWAADLPSENDGRRPSVGNAEVVTIEGFGERGRRPRPSARVSYSKENPDVLEDRPWGDKETECLILGLENFTGSDRFKRIKNHWTAFFKYRSEADLRERALDIRGNLIDADIELADWWDRI